MKFQAGCRLSLWNIVIIGLVSACTSPAQKFDNTATALNLKKEIVEGNNFQHVVYRRQGILNPFLHVYLDGDGVLGYEGRVARDPTPRNPLMLKLISLDDGPAVYVGRPCYHGMFMTSGCSSKLWTASRYSDEVISSTAKAIRNIAGEGKYECVSLFGYSGGGTVARLVAERLPCVHALITIAANLDINRWANYHGYARFSDSIDPILRPPLDPKIIQRHFVGGQDKVVPPSVAQNGITDLTNAFVLIDGYDHVCCWDNLWPSILKTVGVSN